MTDLHGADLSDYQPGVDWAAYAQSRRFVILKASEGMGNVQDVFAPYRDAAHREGLALVGMYHFGHQSNDPGGEVDHFLQVVGDLRPGEVAVLDAENRPDGTAGPDEAWCRSWLTEVARRTGRTPWLYCSWSYWSDRLGSMTDFPLWIAAYGNYDPRAEVPNCRIWQYTSTAPVPGVGRCDDSLFAGTEEDLVGLGASPTARQVTTGWAELDSFLIQEGVRINFPAFDWQTTGGAHTATSWHYRGMARDYSRGTGCDEAAIVAALTPFAVPGGAIVELFHAPTGTWLKNGIAIAPILNDDGSVSHTDHVHGAIRPGASLPARDLPVLPTPPTEEIEMAISNVTVQPGETVPIPLPQQGNRFGTTMVSVTLVAGPEAASVRAVIGPDWHGLDPDHPEDLVIPPEGRRFEDLGTGSNVLQITNNSASNQSVGVLVEAK